MSRNGLWVQIKLGGDLPRALVAGFLEACSDDNVYPEIEAAELESASRDGAPFEISDDNHAESEFEYVESFCRQVGLTYYRYTEGSSDSAPVTTSWRPGLDKPWEVYGHDDVVQVSELVRAFRAGKTLGDVIAESVPPTGTKVSDVPALRIIDPVRLRYRCPSTGCGSWDTDGPDEFGEVDCADCGIWFDLEKEPNIESRPWADLSVENLAAVGS